jgi:hypothetical protein
MQERDWLTGISDALTSSFRLPDLLVAAALMLAGWLLGSFLRARSARLVSRLVDRVIKSPTVRSATERSGVRETLPSVVGGFVFWIVLIFFLAAAIETLGLPVVTDSLGRIAYFLPNVLAAIVVAFAGLLLGNLAHGATVIGAGKAGIPYGDALGRVAQLSILVVAAVIGLEQIGIDSQFIIVLISVALAAVLSGTALAFGLGARTAVANIIAARYVHQTYGVGQTVKIGDTQGRIAETTTVAVVLETGDGRVWVPAKRFSEEVSTLLTED